MCNFLDNCFESVDEPALQNYHVLNLEVLTATKSSTLDFQSG